MVDVKHTPTPWDTMGSLVIRVEGPTSYMVARASSSEDADHIVKCVKMHDELVEVLSKFMDFKDSDYVPNNMFKRAEKTLAKARGEQTKEILNEG